MRKHELSNKQKQYRKVLLAKIHQAPVYLHLYKDDRAAWERFLHDNYRQTSSADLTIAQLVRLCDFLNHKTQAACELASKNQIDYLKNLWSMRARNPSEKSLLEFARANTGLTLISLNVLTKQQASGLIAAAKRMPVQRTGVN